MPTTSDMMTMPMQVSLPLAMYLRVPMKHEKASEVSRPLYLPLRSYSWIRAGLTFREHYAQQTERQERFQL